MKQLGYAQMECREPFRTHNFPRFRHKHQQFIHHFVNLPKATKPVPMSTTPFGPSIKLLKGLIKGDIQRYWLQSTPKGFEELVARFIERLHTRGHTVKSLIPIFMQAAALLDSINNNRLKNYDNNNMLLYTGHTIQRDSREAT